MHLAGLDAAEAVPLFQPRGKSERGKEEREGRRRRRGKGGERGKVEREGRRRGREGVEEGEQERELVRWRAGGGEEERKGRKLKND